MASAILLQAQKESHRNLSPFTGDPSQDVDEYLEKIISIGSLTKESEEVLHILLKEKLSGQAERWYKDNQDSLTTWSQLTIGFRARFQQPWLKQTLFSTLDNRKQEAHESVNDYYDVVCRLCRRVDPRMSQQMILHFLQKGVREDMKTSITRLMLTDNNPTPETFLKFAKIEEHIERTTPCTDFSATHFAQSNPSYLMTTAIDSSSANKRTITPRPYHSPNNSSVNSPTTHRPYGPSSSLPITNSSRQPTINYSNDSRTSSQPSSFSPCLVCGHTTHRTISCYQRQSTGCFKCGDHGHRVTQCPQVFF